MLAARSLSRSSHFEPIAWPRIAVSESPAASSTTANPRHDAAIHHGATPDSLSGPDRLSTQTLRRWQTALRRYGRRYLARNDERRRLVKRFVLEKTAPTAGGIERGQEHSGHDSVVASVPQREGRLLDLRSGATNDSIGFAFATDLAPRRFLPLTSHSRSRSD